MSYHHDHYHYYEHSGGYYLGVLICIVTVLYVIFACWSFVAGIPPLFLLALYFLNNRADKTPNRSLKDMFKAHPVVFVVGAIDCVAALVSWFAKGALSSLAKASTLPTEELAKTFSYSLCKAAYLSTYGILFFVGLLLTVMVVEAYVRAR